MIHLNDFEGLPPLPLVVDDELITSRGAFDQASGTISYMTGFNGCVQLFPLLAQVIIRSKRLAVRRREGRHLSPEEVEVELAWEAELRRTLDGMIASLPPQLRAEWLEGGDAEPSRDAILGMQRANIFVTDASLRICLVCPALVPSLTRHSSTTSPRLCPVRRLRPPARLWLAVHTTRFPASRWTTSPPTERAL